MGIQLDVFIQWAWVLARIKSSYVSLNDTIIGFNQIVSGELDILSEGGFYLRGAIDDVCLEFK